MSYRAWICEGCDKPNPKEYNIWDCPGCGKETCEQCFDRYAHCKSCTVGQSEDALRLAANAKGWDFELPAEAR